MEKTQYIVWDWNGTLLDDVPTCVRVMNGMLRRRGLPLLTRERYREIFTFPVREYYRLAGLDLDREPFEALAVEYIGEYNRRALGCGLYPGAEGVLRRLADAGYTQIIASASERGALARQVEARGITAYFQALLGVGDSLGTTKAGLARDYLRQRGASPADAVFVGDTLHDWEVAAAMGCACVLIEGGHQSRARLEGTGADLLEDIAQLPSYLERHYFEIQR